jgi:RNA-directed DNA polymerase
VIHHAIYQKLYPFFDRLFIADSYSCRLGKGVHKALARFCEFGRQVSRNDTSTAWVLKCDIKKFFASIDHRTLLLLLEERISDQRIIWLLGQVINSFHFGSKGKGLPLGNLTSQLFCNIYMNEFDQFAKHELKAHHYIRYADDFVTMSRDKKELEQLIPRMAEFLEGRLHLRLHPNKVFIRTLASGVDFLGWVHFPNHRVLRGVTRKRLFKRVGTHPTNETLQSYLGLIGHGDTHELKERLLNWYGFLR